MTTPKENNLHSQNRMIGLVSQLALYYLQRKTGHRLSNKKEKKKRVKKTFSRLFTVI